jgi:Ca2+-binding RTX toxin-like protein
MGGSVHRTRRVLPAVAAGLLAASVAGVIAAPSSGAAAAPPAATVVGVGNGVLNVIDWSTNNNAFIRVSEKNVTTALIQSADRIVLSSGCQYTWRIDKDKKNDNEPGYDRYATCAGVMASYDVYGLDGNDSITVDHPSGAVQLVGGEGDDFLKVISGRSIMYGDYGPGDVAPNWAAGGNDNLNGGKDADVMYGNGGNDAIRGGAGPDQLFGQLGDDVIDGGDGADVITGSWGRDQVNGQKGKDVFRERDGNFGSDQIVCGGDEGIKDVLEFDAGIDVLVGCDLETGARK